MMMKNVAIATDSHSSITPETAQTLGVAVLPMPFTIDGICYLEEETLTRAEFYAHQRRGEDADKQRDCGREGRADEHRLAEAAAEAVVLPGAVVLGDEGGKGVAEVLHGQIGKRVDLDGSGKGRHRRGAG